MTDYQTNSTNVLYDPQRNELKIKKHTFRGFACTYGHYNTEGKIKLTFHLATTQSEQLLKTAAHLQFFLLAAVAGIACKNFKPFTMAAMLSLQPSPREILTRKVSSYRPMKMSLTFANFMWGGNISRVVIINERCSYRQEVRA